MITPITPRDPISIYVNPITKPKASNPKLSPTTLTHAHLIWVTNMPPELHLLGTPKLHLPAQPKPTTETPLASPETHSSILLSNNSNPSLEFFFGSYSNDSFFEKAWKHDPLTTLKLIYYQRILSESDKETFYYGAHWLHMNHH